MYTILVLYFLAYTYTVLASVEPLNYDRVHLVDAIPAQGTFLFRGNQPEINNTFAYSTLKQYLTQRALEEGNLTLPNTFYLLDITLLDASKPDEEPSLEVEINFMKQNPKLGSLINWPLQGDSLSPSNYSEPKRTFLAETLSVWQPDQLPSKVSAIRSLMTRQDKQTDLPLVIYVHCGHGQDRTGEMTGSYELQFNLKTFQEIWTYDTDMGMDVVENENALLWYCAYFAATNGEDSSFCTTTL